MVDIFCNPSILMNIRDAEWTLKLHSNVGNAVITKKGDLKGYRMVW